MKRPGQVARLKAKLAKANQEAEEVRRRLGVMQMRCEHYREQAAALSLMADTQNHRITKLIGMLEATPGRDNKIITNPKQIQL